MRELQPACHRVPPPELRPWLPDPDLPLLVPLLPETGCNDWQQLHGPPLAARAHHFQDDKLSCRDAPCAQMGVPAGAW
eukprot:4878803-Pleurochrysis_carterae.AAC.1